jgi:hypothetical protein
MNRRIVPLGVALAAVLLSGQAAADELQELGLYDGTGQRIGTLQGQAGGGHVGVYGRDGQRIGFGRVRPDGTTELFDSRGNRTATVRDGRVTVYGKGGMPRSAK